MMRRPVRWIAIATAFILAGPAHGQFGRGDQWSPPVTARDLQDIASELDLTDEQRQVAEMLFEGLREQYEQKAGVLRRQFERMREERNWQGMRDLGDEMRAFRQEREAMQESLLNDVKAILTTEQSAQWPAVERSLRRSQTLGRGLMRAERVDLVRLTRDFLNDDLSGDVQATVDRYATELDRELVKRNEMFEDGMERAREMMRAGDEEGIAKLMEEARDASMRVRDLNQRYSRLIASMLPEDRRDEFNAEVRREAFPDVYRPTGASRALEAAKGFADLDEAQRQGIEALAISYQRDSSTLNERLVKAIESWEEDASARELMPWRRNRGDRPGMELRRERRELSESAVESLKKILTEEQISRLPDPEEFEWREGRDGRRRDGAGARRQRQDIF